MQELLYLPIYQIYGLQCYLGTSLVGRVFANDLGDMGSIPGHVIPKTLKMIRDAPCLILSNIRYISRVKWSNPGKGLAPSPTPWCSSYCKRSLLVALDYVRQLYITYLLLFYKTQLVTMSYLNKCWLAGFMASQPLLDYLMPKSVFMQAVMLSLNKW